MNKKEVCMYHYMKLKTLMENDCQNISVGLRGDLLESYRDLLKKELEVLSNIINQVNSKI